MRHRKTRILLFSRDPGLVDIFKTTLESSYSILEVREAELLKPLLERKAGLVAVDLSLPGSLLEEGANTLADYEEIPVLVLGRTTAESWDRISRGGPLEAMLDPNTSPQDLRVQVEELLEKGRFLQGQILVGNSRLMRELRQKILLVAPTPMTVLLSGESGTGKEVVASALHRYSARREGPFIQINCGAIHENLIESELFGHEKGAFTDARNRRLGIFEEAGGGTVFLDEIGEMALSAQVRLLRVLERHEITRVGGNTAIPVDIRVVAASNKDLQQAVGQGEFRLDLYYRLKVVEWTVPPLRQRPEDIAPLIQHFVDELAQKNQVRFEGLSPTALDLLQEYDWPGNVRELRNLVDHLAFLGPRGQIEPRDLLPHLERPPTLGTHLPVPTSKTPDQSERELIYFALLDLKREVSELRRLVEDRLVSPVTGTAPAAPIYPLEEVAIADDKVEKATPILPPEARERTLKDLEKEAIEQALLRVGGNRKKAAEVLDIGVRTLYRKLDEYNLK